MTTRKRGVDSLLTSRGKSLPTGGSVAFRLVKGPNNTVTADPVDPKAPHESFPLVAKFPESVVKPDFEGVWKDGRLYQQDVPKQQDSDDEDTPKKRWRYKNDQPARQWVLQEQVDFLETMVARREKKPIDPKKLSSRYEGAPEHSNSHYVLFKQSGDSISVITLPQRPTVTFAQPASRKTFSLSEAEQVINDQRHNIKTLHNHGEVVDRVKVNDSKTRLMDRLKAKVKTDAEEADDVMGDVAFRNRKGNTGSRKELFSLGDVAVSDDGVLGGTNDQAFGGRQRFGAFKGDKLENAAKSNEERGADGAAMPDDFYQRDVGAEYEELDYDANEQFDDDDVDLGEAEVVVDDRYAEDTDDDMSIEGIEEEVVAGAEGLATVAGFKAMLAKARGEVPAQADEAAEKKAVSPKQEEKKDEGDHFSKIIAAAETARATEEKQTPAKPAPGAQLKSPTDASSIQFDDQGQRIITLEAVRREIWLNHGSIPMKRLMKIFEVKKKSSQERQEKFRNVVKELCTMKTDPVGGRLLVLKQHYSKMG